MLSAEATWEQVELPTSKNLMNIEFLNDSFGWIFAYSRDSGCALLKTEDGGATWEEIELPYEMYNCEFVTEEVVYGGYNEGHIYKSTDGGYTWQLFDTDYVGLFDQFSFIDETYGWAAGSAVWQTIDAGNTWFQQDHVGFGHTWDMRFYDINKGARTGFAWPGAEKQAYVCITEDSGNLWERYDFTQYKEFRNLAWIDDNTICVIGNSLPDSTSVYGYSTDGGQNWSFKEYEAEIVQAGSIIDVNNVWSMSRYGEILHSVDGGQNWQMDHDFQGDAENPYFDMCFLDETNGWVAGSYGRLYHYYDATSNENEVVQPAPIELAQNYPNPFNPQTTISYELKKQASVQLAIYDVKGRKVNILVNETKTTGNHSVVWNGTNSQGDEVPSGVYFYVLSCENYQKTNKMILLK
jgi:photosystem II stability/assembly factor-like uncharacterized protein